MEELRRKIFDIINGSNLPAECVYYIIKDIYRDIENTYFQYLDSIKIKEEKDNKVESD